MRRRNVWPRASDAREAGLSAGRNRRLDLVVEWLALWPTIGPTPVSSQRRDMMLFAFARKRDRAGVPLGSGRYRRSRLRASRARRIRTTGPRPVDARISIQRIVVNTCTDTIPCREQMLNQMR